MVDDEEFRKGLRAFTTGVAVVMVESDAGLHGMTLSSFAAVSMAPRLVLFSVKTNARSHALLCAADRYTVNLLQASQLEVAHHFAGVRRDGFEPGFDRVAGWPVLPDCLGFFGCRSWAQYPGGDHTIFVGEVVKVGRSDAAPLVCSRGAFHELGGRVNLPAH